MSDQVTEAGTTGGVLAARGDFREPPQRGDRKLARRRRLIPYLLLSPGGIYLFFLFLVPLAVMLYTSLQSGGILSGGFKFTWQWDNYSHALSDGGKFYLRSLEYSTISTLICMGLAYPMAYWIAFYGGRWKSSLFFLILLPFFVSFVIRTVQWKFILGDNGLIFAPLKNLGLLSTNFHVLASPKAVIAGLTYNFLPFTALPLYVALDRIDRRLVEAAKDLYATKFEAFRKVVFPLSLPGVFAAVILTFVPMTGDYVNAQVLGGPGTSMIGNVIQTQYLTRANYPEAAAMSVILMLAMLVIASIYARALGTEDSTLSATV
jgi:spermidine/putrescine transport system permease protein